MPNFDYEFYLLGYKPIRLESVFETAKHRKPGYLDAVQQKMVLRDGIYYMKDEDYFQIKKDYSTDAIPATTPSPKKLKQTTYFPESVDFFNLDTPCPDKPGWQELRQLYVAELEKAGGTSCPACKKNGIKHKYLKLLEQLK